jgi:hypothetical protein
MTASEVIAEMSRKGITLVARGDRLAYDAPKGVVTPELVTLLRQHKPEILAILTAPSPIGCAWREDERGNLIFSDGTVYSPTSDGGWILTRHPTKRVIRPGTLAVNP